MRYSFVDNGVVNVLRYDKTSNTKLGPGTTVLGTYHFSIPQILSTDLSLDGDVCFNCEYSYNQGDHSCYTHYGLQRFGLISMMKSLRRSWPIEDLSAVGLSSFYDGLRNIPPALTRFGVYGEPVLLRHSMVRFLTKISKAHTGYTHQWANPKYDRYKEYLMASTSSPEAAKQANELGWRVFNVGKLNNAVNCPASKEAGRVTTCAKCALCGGTTRKGNRNIYILKH